MANALETSQHKSSDVVYKVCCSICEYDGIHKEGLFYCQKCSKYFCDSCVLTHNNFLKDHSVSAKGGDDNWPVTKTVDDALELCEEHKTEKLTMFCEDDEKLLCHVCLLRNHKQCGHVVLLTDKVKSTTRPLDVAQMKTSIESLMERHEDMLKIGEQNSMFLQTSYEKVLEEILDVRRQINNNRDVMQQNTERKLEELHCTLKNSLENKRKRYVECISILKGYKITEINKTTPERSFIMYRKCLDQTASANACLRKATTHAVVEFRINKDLEQFLASCTEFGSIASREDVSHHVVDPNKVVSINDRLRYNVRTATDKGDCRISGICYSSGGKFVIADHTHNCLKLLDQAYNFIMETKLPSSPWSMSNISTNEIAVTVGYTKKIHFLRVDKGMIEMFKRLQLNHSCFGIAIHQGDLLVTSGSAVCQYTIDGRLVKTLYEDKSGASSPGVGVSPDGKRIYVTDRINCNLRTLTRDGTVTATLHDPAFKTKNIIDNIHVATKGQVFVLGDKHVSQVDTDGKKVLNTIKLDISRAGSIYVNEDTSKISVGYSGNDVIEFKTHAS